MVTLKNNFGVEPDKDSVVMNVSEGVTNDAKSSVSGHPKAILIWCRNSLPFQARTLILNKPAKIGRCVARARPNSNNGIFNCKVLSRNHAIIWYEYDTAKFMIQDTKSSNGTFVNKQRLSKGGETSLPREFFSRDVVQFGVEVLENQRKGYVESENSDKNNRLVTHECIVATVRLFHPNGEESKSRQSSSTPNPIPQEKICKLELIIHEAQQREERLHDKLEELQLIIRKLEVACQEALTNRFEETRLLSKIENLEKQTKIMSKIMPGTAGKGSEKVEAEIQQLLVDIEKVQSVAREIQERQHRKLLESEQKLVEAQRVASNLELEVIALREQASLTESHLQEMGAKCTAYCQTINTLKSNLHEQIEPTEKLETRLAKLEEHDLTMTIMDKYKYIPEDSDDAFKKDKEGQEVILGWSKNYEETDKLEEKDFINDNDKMEWISEKLDNLADAMCSGLEHISHCLGQLENSLIEVEKSKKTVEKLCARKNELALQLESARMPVEKIEKTEIDVDKEKHELVKPVILPSLSNEKITELENELKEQEETLNQARLNQEESEGKCSILRYELDATIKRCEKFNVESCNLKTLLRNHLKCFEESTSLYRQKIMKLEAEVEELENGQEQKLLEILGNKCRRETEVKETQTISLSLTSSSTNTDFIEERGRIMKESIQNLSNESENREPLSSESELHIRKLSSLESSSLNTDTVDNTNREKLKSENSSPMEHAEEIKVVETYEKEVHRLEKLISADNDWSTCKLGLWEKIRKMQVLLSSQLLKESPLSDVQISEMRSLMNLVAEDLVHLLLREQQISKDKQNLQEKLDKSMSEADFSTLGLTMHLRTIILFSVTAVAAYFMYSTFL